MRKVLSIGLVSILMASMLSGCATNSSGAINVNTVDSRNKVTVNSSSNVQTVPDMAELNVTLRSFGGTADEAQKDVAGRMNDLVAVLKDNAVAEESIQTTSYDVWPEYNYSGDYEELVGYDASAYLTISDQAIDGIGDLINLCTENGVDYVDGVSFSCSNYDEVYAEALAQAVSDARSKAEIIAESEGKKVGTVMDIEEGYQDTYYQYKSVNNVMADGFAESASADIMAGQADIEASVTVTFELVD